MKKGTIILIAVIAVIAIIAFSCVGTYNSLVAQRENVDTQYSAIETQLQRRIDLIPNIVNTVKGYAAHESEVFGAVSDARARLAGASTKEEAAEADSELTSAVSRLLMIAENYPDLKAHQELEDAMQQNSYLQREITAAREYYNDVVAQWNMAVNTLYIQQLVAAEQGYTTRIPFATTAEIKEQARGEFF